MLKAAAVFGNNMVLQREKNINIWGTGMELELQNSKDGRRVVENIKYGNVRFYTVPRLSYIDEEFFERESENSWQECSPETAGTWSAVGYYFAEKLARELNVTVGVIGCNWGGTSASAWISRESLELDKDTNTYVEEYNKVNEGRSFEQYLEELAD